MTGAGIEPVAEAEAETRVEDEVTGGVKGRGAEETLGADETEEVDIRVVTIREDTGATTEAEAGGVETVA